MIGNDIVDIDYTRKYIDWKRRGWVQKIFNSYEQEIITDSMDPFTTVWRLWSMKESVYKVHLRSKQERSFYPSKIACKIFDGKIGLAAFDGIEYSTETEIDDQYIYSSASTYSKGNANHHIYSCDELKINSNNYHNFILDKISKDLSLNRNQMHIKKCALGIPYLYFDDLQQDACISITHHGKYLAFSIAHNS